MDARNVYFLFIVTSGQADTVAQQVAMLGDEVRWTAVMANHPDSNVIAAVVMDSSEIESLKTKIRNDIQFVRDVYSAEVPGGWHYTYSDTMHLDPFNGWP